MSKIGRIIEELEQIISEEEKAMAKLTLDNGETVETETEGSDEDIKKQYQVGQNISVGRNGMNRQAKIKSVQVTRTVGESFEDKLNNDPVLIRRAKELGYDKMSKEELKKEYKTPYNARGNKVMGSHVDLVDNQILYKLLKEEFYQNRGDNVDEQHSNKADRTNNSITSTNRNVNLKEENPDSLPQKNRFINKSRRGEIKVNTYANKSNDLSYNNSISPNDNNVNSVKENYAKVHPRKFKINEIEEETRVCKWCGEEYPESDMHKEKDMGWLCDQCIRGIESRGEELEFDEKFFKKELTPLLKKKPGLKKGDTVVVDNVKGKIVSVKPMKLSDTSTYKIKLDDGETVWRYEEEIKQPVAEMDMGDLGTDPIGKMGVVKAKGLARNRKFKKQK